MSDAVAVRDRQEWFEQIYSYAYIQDTHVYIYNYICVCVCEKTRRYPHDIHIYPPRLLKYDVPGLHAQPSGPVFAHADMFFPSQDGRQWSELVSAAPWSARWGFGAAALKDRLVIMGGSALWTICDAAVVCVMPLKSRLRHLQSNPLMNVMVMGEPVFKSREIARCPTQIEG